MKPGQVDALVSVVMAVHNGAKYVQQTIDSVLVQSYRNFEFVIVDDASTDETPEILKRVSDPRVRLVRSDRQRGLASSLLAGVRASSGEYLARIDADDVCFRRRLERQVRFLASNPEVDVLGGAAVLIGRRPLRVKWHHRDNNSIQVELLFRSALIHPTVMFRMRSIPEWYDASFLAAEDYELWARLASKGVRFANLRTPLIKYRLHSERASEVRAHQQQSESDVVRAVVLRRLLEDSRLEDAVLLSKIAARARTTCDDYELDSMLRLRETVLTANAAKYTFDQARLEETFDYEIALTALASMRTSPRVAANVILGLLAKAKVPVIARAVASATLRAVVHRVQGN